MLFFAQLEDSCEAKLKPALFVGVQYNGSSNSLALDPYPGAGTIGMLTYAQNEGGCIREILPLFMDYLPFILLLQVISLVVVEKFTFRLPQVGQKVERFHKIIVEESLFGSGPDDVTGPKVSTDVVSRRRQRNEICVSMKRGSIIHNVYILKNCLEIVLCGFFVFLNLSSTLPGSHYHGPCVVDINAISGVVTLPGKVFFQVAKKEESWTRRSDDDASNPRLFFSVVKSGICLLLQNFGFC